MGLQSENKNFGAFSAILVVISLITYILDTLTDIVVGIQYMLEWHFVWGSLTLFFVLLPSITIQMFSLRWYILDGKMTHWYQWLLHLFQLQPLERYIKVFMAGMRARSTGIEEDIDQYLYQQNDVCMLRLFESFLESAPQIGLQMYVILCTNDDNWLTGSAAVISLFALGWSVAMYTHALRQAHKEDYRTRWPGLILQTLWHMGTVAARVTALVAFASVFKAWVFLVLALHWGIMTTWIILQNTDFCPSVWEEKLFDCIVGLIYCFSFFNLKEGRTRYRMAAFYVFMFVENVLLMGLWYAFRDPNLPYTEAMIGVATGAFAVGVLCLVTYYRFCHPGGPIYCVQTEVERVHLPQDESPRMEAEESETEVATDYQLEKFMPKAKAASCTMLPRRSFLKPHFCSATNIEFKQIFTPTQLTPIQSFIADEVEAEENRRRHRYDVECTELEDLSAFQHYSVDASAFLMEPCSLIQSIREPPGRGDHDDVSLAAPSDKSYSKIEVESVGFCPVEAEDMKYIDTSEATPQKPKGGSFQHGYVPSDGYSSTDIDLSQVSPFKPPPGLLNSLHHTHSSTPYPTMSTDNDLTQITPLCLTRNGLQDKRGRFFSRHYHHSYSSTPHSTRRDYQFSVEESEVDKSGLQDTSLYYESVVPEESASLNEYLDSQTSGTPYVSFFCGQEEGSSSNDSCPVSYQEYESQSPDYDNRLLHCSMNHSMDSALGPETDLIRGNCTL